jgi:hypothetical protein
MIKKIVKDFKFRANLFESKWDYTRNHNIKEIRLDKTYYSYDNLWNRIKRSVKALFSHKGIYAQELLGPWTIKTRISFAIYLLSRDPNLPDGHLAGGKIITYWEEDGEYLQLVQPSVGSLLADFLEQEPENPHAVLIVKEMERINRDYIKRLKAENQNENNHTTL